MPADSTVARRELVFRLRDYLGELSPESHRTLSRSIDRARARGETSPVHAIIMDALRSITDLSDGESRIPSAERAFFEPLSPIVVSPPLPDKQVGLIDRGSLRAIWSWITRDLAPGRCDTALASLRAAIVDEDFEAIDDHAEELRQAVARHAADLIAETETKFGSVQRLEGQLGSPRILADLHDMLAFFDQRPALEAFLAALPAKMPVGQGGLEAVETALQSYRDRPQSDRIYAFAAISERLGSPSDLVRFAVHYAKSSDPALIRGSTAAGAIQIALAEAMRAVELVRLQLLEGADIEKLSPTLRQYHELVSAISRTLDDEPKDPWLKRLAAIRARASDLLCKELDPLLHLMHRSIGVMEARGKQITPDPSSIEEAVFGVRLFMVARDMRGSLALNTLIDRLEKGIEDALENQGKQAIDRLSAATEDNWDAAVARSAAAARLFSIFHGGAYGASMTRRHTQAFEAHDLAKAG